MAHFSDQSGVESEVILLGDHDTVRRDRDKMSEHATQQGCVVVEAYSFAPGEAASADDLTEIDAVVSALGHAIAHRLHNWVPFPGPDLGREQHWRRLSLVLQRHALNLRFGWDLDPCATTGGFNEIDFALRREVHAVDDLDNAVLAALGGERLSREIELALVAADASASGSPSAGRRRGSGVGADADAGVEGMSSPALPAPTAPWRQRRPVLKRYVRWLVHDCGVTQAATARVLNSTGQRTPKGRLWQPATVSALLNGRYDRGTAA